MVAPIQKVADAEQRKAKHLAYIHANWERLAPLAVEGARLFGRGMVFLVQDIEGTIQDKEPTPPMFIGETHLGMPGGLAAWPSSREGAWVKAYDPATTLLVCVVSETGAVDSYCISERSAEFVHRGG